MNDHEPTNTDRADLAREALFVYPGTDEIEDARDLLVDLFHLLAEHGQDPEDVVGIALIHYATETGRID